MLGDGICTLAYGHRDIPAEVETDDPEPARSILSHADAVQQGVINPHHRVYALGFNDGREPAALHADIRDFTRDFYSLKRAAPHAPPQTTKPKRLRIDSTTELAPQSPPHAPNFNTTTLRATCPLHPGCACTCPVRPPPRTPSPPAPRSPPPGPMPPHIPRFEPVSLTPLLQPHHSPSPAPLRRSRVRRRLTSDTLSNAPLSDSETAMPPASAESDSESDSESQSSRPPTPTTVRTAPLFASILNWRPAYEHLNPPAQDPIPSLDAIFGADPESEDEFD